jgi:uncharacterized membrane protein YkoI
MKTTLQMLVAVWVLGAAVAMAAPGGKHRLSVPDGPAAPADSLPPLLPAVRQAILAEAAGATIDECQRTTEEGEAVYEVNITRNSVERTFTVGLDGGIRSRQHFLAELPAAVQQTVATLKSRGDLGNIYWCDEAGDLVYEVEIGNGTDKCCYTIAPDGTLLASQRELTELPAPVQKTIREQAGADIILSVSRDETEVDVSFDAVLLRDGRRRIVSVNAAGAVVATQVLSVQTPLAVQDGIAKAAGVAKLIYIGACTEEGATVYAVVAVQGARRDEFVVDAEGKLLSRVVALDALPEPAQKYLRAQAGDARIARIEQLADGTFSADLDRHGKKQVLAFTAAGAAH